MLLGVTQKVTPESLVAFIPNMPSKVAKPRTTRSISFETPLLEFCKKLAQKHNRTVNWIVNEAVRLELRKPALTSAGVTAVD